MVAYSTYRYYLVLLWLLVGCRYRTDSGQWTQAISRYPEGTTAPYYYPEGTVLLSRGHRTLLVLLWVSRGH
ncbi:hypothetical protein BZA05DRAFT_385357 [Tricharina praecox]|uniref:uncharacterized protein n=1 Tax=Tricharina praecox TaxID=43433 RepID=UPI0022212212|nr:uncharacterized protein BZA05DRAFT_385357 [Tricharina praecox]KAI5857954.1 hypothetical protein BZA05DRAFT_385357 [Tricharina praecox]